MGKGEKLCLETENKRVLSLLNVLLRCGGKKGAGFINWSLKKG